GFGVEPEGGETRFGNRRRQRQADVAEPDDADDRAPALQQLDQITHAEFQNIPAPLPARPVSRSRRPGATLRGPPHLGLDRSAAPKKGNGGPLFGGPPLISTENLRETC